MLAESGNENDLFLTNPSICKTHSSNGAYSIASGGDSVSHSGFKKKVIPEANGASSLDKLLYPRVTGRPDIAPYRVVLGHVREKVVHFASGFGLAFL